MDQLYTDAFAGDALSIYALATMLIDDRNRQQNDQLAFHLLEKIEGLYRGPIFTWNYALQRYRS